MEGISILFKRLKFVIYTRPFICLAYYIIRIYSLTFRLKVENESAWMALVKTGKRRVLLCTWHQQFFAAINHFKSYGPLNPGIMISQSKDGELIAGVANRNGWRTARGSSSRGGKAALSAMIDHVRCHGFGAHIPDGPTGPMGKVKPGVIKLALDTEALLVPFYVKADDAWYFNSWDRFMLPKPFSRVRIVYDAPIELDPEVDFETLRQNLEDQMAPGLCRLP